MYDDWKNGEYEYCRRLVQSHGALMGIGTDPQTVASYLRLQASDAFRFDFIAASARLGVAATCINEDARNNHEPRWDDALAVLELPE